MTVIANPIKIFSAIHYEKERIITLLEESSISVYQTAREILNKTSFLGNNKPFDFKFGCISPRDLNTHGLTVLGDFYRVAEKAKARSCFGEEIIHARLHYVDQPEGEHLTVAMLPISDGRGGRVVLNFQMKNGVKILDTENWAANRIIDPDRKFLFRL
jgi:hypothetical protein